MRLLVTADLHYNHAVSRPRAIELIEQMNHVGGDVLLLVGDTAVADGDALEQCLNRFKFAGPKLIVAGNHELWTKGADSATLHASLLAARAAALGWQWIENDPYVAGDLVVVGSVGWYDYSFAAPSLGIPQRFYQHKISPGAAAHLGIFPQLFSPAEDITATARQTIARWNDGKFVKLGRSDEQFLADLLRKLEAQLAAIPPHSTIVAAIHHIPFRELLPPHRGQQWDFARAYLGSDKIGQLLARYENVHHLFCGHSHWPVTAQIGNIQAVNIGSGYREKRFWAGEVGSRLPRRETDDHR